MAGKTEWEDILIKHGIIEAPPKPLDPDLVQEVAQEALEQAKRDEMESKTLDELNELEDELDEEVLRRFRAARLAEMRERAAKEKFGEVRQITRPEFVDEVTKASEQCWVVCHLFKDSIPLCQVVNAHLDKLARKHKAVKFVKIVGDMCIPDYPEHAMPTLVIYHGGKMVVQKAGAAAVGGPRVTKDDLERLLIEVGALEE